MPTQRQMRPSATEGRKDILGRNNPAKCGGGEAFDRAQRAAVDYSSRTGKDLQSSTIMIGKALNDPIKGLTALNKVGVQFTDQQKDMIKAMVAAGDTAGAQKVILGELEKQYGGSGKALRDATPGAALQNAWDNFQETVGAIVVQVLPPLTDMLSGVLDAFNNLSPGTQSFIVGAAALAAAIGPVLVVVGSLVSAVGAIAPVFAPVVALIGEVGLAGALAAAATAAAPFIAAGAALAAAWALFGDKIGPVLTMLWEKLQATLGPKLTALFETVKTTLTDLWNGPLGDMIRVVIGVIGDLGAAFTETFGTLIVNTLASALDIVNGFFKQVGLVFKAIGQILTGDFAGAWETVKEMWDNAVTTLLNVIANFSPQVAAYLRDLYIGVREWLGNKVTAIFDWVKEKIQGLADKFKWLWDVVVGHSYVPDMVDAIGQNMARLQSLMVVPATKATNATAKAFRGLAQDNRGGRIVMALRRDLGEKAPGGGKWPVADSDPEPLPEFAAAVRGAAGDPAPVP